MAPEQGHHAARRVQHIAEPDRDIAGTVGVPQGLAIEFRQALAGAHDVGWVDRLIGGNQHKLSATQLAGGIRHLPGAQHVDPHRLPGLAFQHGHMLIGSGVIDHLRPLLRKQTPQTGRVGHVAQADDQIQQRECLAQFHLDGIQVEFTIIQDHQPGWSLAGNLPAKFGADGAPTAGDQDHPSRHTPADGVPVQGHGFPAQQILDGNCPHLVQTHLAGNEFVQFRQGVKGHAGLFAQIHQAAHLPAAGGGNGQYDQVNGLFRH